MVPLYCKEKKMSCSIPCVGPLLRKGGGTGILSRMKEGSLLGKTVRYHSSKPEEYSTNYQSGKAEFTITGKDLMDHAEQLGDILTKLEKSGLHATIGVGYYPSISGREVLYIMGMDEGYAYQNKDTGKLYFCDRVLQQVLELNSEFNTTPHCPSLKVESVVDWMKEYRKWRF